MQVLTFQDFVPSYISPELRVKRLKVFLENLILAPAFEVVRTSRSTGYWALYFIYVPSGEIFDQHRYTLEQLHSSGFRILAVVAAPKSQPLLDSLQIADAIIFKELAGFDFSGYAIGLQYLTQTFGTVDVLVLNDSVLGPFYDLMPLVNQIRWRLTGFTSSFAVENHFQSYGFIIKGLDEKLLKSLQSVFFPWVALNFHRAVAFLQETRLARCGSRTCSVGALWSPLDRLTDLTMAMPLELVHQGFPFLKRSLLGKFASDFCRESLLALLRAQQHPISAKLFPGFRFD